MRALNKKTGLTTMEVAVATTVLVAVVFMSFDVMLRSIKVSAGAMQASTTNDDLRSGMDQLVNTIRTADMIVYTHTADQTVQTGTENLLIKRPVFNSLGNRTFNKSQIVWYYYQTTTDKRKKPGIIFARTSTINGSTIGNFSAPREIVYNVSKVTWSYRFAAQLRMANTGISLPLNFNASTNKPTASNAQVCKLKCNLIGLNVDTTQNIGILPSILSNTVTLPVVTPAGAVIDLEAKIDPAYAPLSGGGSLANIVEMKIQFNRNRVDSTAATGPTAISSEGEIRRNELYNIKLQNFRG